MSLDGRIQKPKFLSFMIRKEARLIPLFSLEARIKRSLRRHLRNVGFSRTSMGSLQPPGESKETIRNLHRAQRSDLLKKEKEFVDRSWPKLKSYFADGTEVVAERIDPELELIKGETWQSDLFRLACLTWSVPVSQGYGRRLRFLVWDRSNGKLIGLIGLGDPVFNLKVRDQLIGWNATQRKKRLVNLMDAYVLGAVPPYNFLLCGKMIACLIRTKEIREQFSTKYNDTKGIISNQHKHARLVVVTTSSALGRSSLYNRLVLDGTRYFEPIGYTAGWGHFHIPASLFDLIREYLKLKDHKYFGNNRFGQGPNWRLRAIRYTLSSLNLNPNLLRHGINRQVFQCQLASNVTRFLTGKATRARYKGLLSIAEVAKLSLARWVLPRAMRRTEYRNWKRENISELLRAEKYRAVSSQDPIREASQGGPR